MVEPVSIASGAANLSKAAWDISVALYRFIQDVSSVDRTIADLRFETEALARLLDSISVAVSNPLIKSNPTVVSENAGLLRSIRQTTARCRITLDSLKAAIPQGQVQKKGIFRQSIVTIKLNLSTEDIHRLRNDIHMQTQRLQIALQTINLLVSCSTPNYIIDRIIPQIHELTNLVRTTITLHQCNPAARPMQPSRIDQLRDSAQSVISKAVTAAGGAASVWGSDQQSTVVGSVICDAPTNQQNDRLHQWIDERRREERRPDVLDNSSPVGNLLRPKRKTNFMETVYQVENGPVDEEQHSQKSDKDMLNTDDLEDDIEYEISKMLMKQFHSSCTEGDVAKAEEIYASIQGSMKALSNKHQTALKLEEVDYCLAMASLTHANTLIMRAIPVTDDAATAILKAVDLHSKRSLPQSQHLSSEICRTKAMFFRIRLKQFNASCDHCSAQDAEDAYESILGQAIQLSFDILALHAISEAQFKLAKLCARENHFERAEVLLESLCRKLSTNDEEALAVACVKHVYAEVLFCQEKFADAAVMCKAALNARGKLQGKTCDAYNSAINLMGHIYESQKDRVRASAYFSKLPDGRVALQHSFLPLKLEDPLPNSVWSGLIDSELGILIKSSLLSKDVTIKELWKRPSAQLPPEPCPCDPVRGITMHPLGQKVAFCTASRVTFWDLVSDMLEDFLFVLGSDKLMSVQFAPSGQLLAILSKQRLQIWEVSTRTLLRLFHNVAPGCYAFALGDNLFFSERTSSKRIYVWKNPNFANRVEVMAAPFGHIGFITVSPCGQYLAARNETKLAIFNVQNGTFSAYTGIQGISPAYEGPLCFANAQQLLFANLGSLAAFNGKLKKFEFEYLPNVRKVTTMACSISNKIIVTGHEDGEVKIWDAYTRRSLSQYRNSFWLTAPHTDPITGLIFSPDEKHVMSSSMDGTIRLWDIMSIEPNLLTQEDSDS